MLLDKPPNGWYNRLNNRDETEMKGENDEKGNHNENDGVQSKGTWIPFDYGACDGSR